MDFEIFNAYATQHSVLLKKAVLVQGLPEITKTNAAKIETLLKVIKHIKGGHKGLYETYVELINDFDGVNFFKNQSFLLSQILESAGEGLSFSSCVHCGSNQDLFAFDVLQGGMLCKKHSKINTPLTLLKSLFLLGESREKYVDDTSAETNQQVFNILSNLLF